MADFAAPAPEDDQQPAASEAAGPEGTGAEAPAADPQAADPQATEAEPLPEPAWAAMPAAEQPPAEPEQQAVLPVQEATAAAEPVAPLNAAPMAPEPVIPEPVLAEPVATEPAATEPTAAIAPPAFDTPSIASTIEVPASASAASDAEGGEWALLVQKLSAWLSSGQLQQQWQSARSPLSLLAGLIALLLVVRIYSALLGVIESLPLLPGLLELVGVIAVVRFSLTRLVRSGERQQLIEGLQQRWKSFRGQG